MRHYILSFFLIFAFVTVPSYAYACWDDDYDDYYGYDDDDDDYYDDYYYDWGEDDDDDGYDDDYGNDGYDDDYDYGYGNSDEPINGGTLVGVEVTPDYDWGLDEDWWRTDYGNDDCGNGNDDGDDSSDEVGIGGIHDNNNSTTDVIVPPLLPREVHKPESNEKLFNQDLPIRYPRQTCNWNCFTTTIAICNALMTGDFNFESYATYIQAIEELFSIMFNREICVRGINPSEVDRFLTDGCGLIYDYINESNITSCIDNGDLVMVTIGSGSHEIAIVGYYDDGYGIDAYQCVNPANGQYETHYGYEFNKDLIIKYYKNHK